MAFSSFFAAENKNNNFKNCKNTHTAIYRLPLAFFLPFPLLFGLVASIWGAPPTARGARCGYKLRTTPRRKMAAVSSRLTSGTDSKYKSLSTANDYYNKRELELRYTSKAQLCSRDKVCLCQFSNWSTLCHALQQLGGCGLYVVYVTSGGRG